MTHAPFQPGRHARPARLLAALVLGLAGSVASAQVADLPATLPSSASIGSDQRSQIDAFVSAHATTLADGDAARVRASRDALLRPLTAQTVTIAFRQAYAAALEPVIDRLVASTDVTRQLAGMRLAGEAATEHGARVLLDALDSDDTGLRVFAMGRLERVLSSAGSAAPGLPADTARAVVDRLAESITSEPDPRLADAAVRALAEAVRSTTPAFTPVRFAAVDALGSKLGDRLRAAKADAPRAQDEMLLALRGVGVTREAVADANARPTADAAVATARLGGDAIAYAFARVQAGLAPADNRSIEAQLVAAGEAAVYFGRVRHAEARGLASSAIQPTTLESLLSAGKDREFRNSFVQLFGPSSAIVESLGIDRQRFLRPDVAG
jgi:hypothetical protein